MTNQIVNIVEISTLHDILNEIKSIFSFKISNFSNTQDFLNHENNKDLDASNSIIISNKNSNHSLLSKTIDPKNLILIENIPIRIGPLIDKINILKSGFEDEVIRIHENLKKKEISFLHSGHLGDVINALPVIKELSKNHICNLYLQTKKLLPTKIIGYKHASFLR